MDTKEEITETDNKADAHKKASKASRSRKIRTAIIIVEIILILLECAVLYVVNKLDRVQRVAISVDELQENISEEVKANAESGQMKGYTNIALFGVDTRTGDLENNTRSDTILIASINNTTKEVKLVSVFRDVAQEVESPAAIGLEGDIGLIVNEVRVVLAFFLKRSEQIAVGLVAKSVSH